MRALKLHYLVILVTAAVISIVAYSVFLCFLYFSPTSPRNKVASNMALASEHIPQLSAILEKDNRFAKIRLVSYTGEGGCLGVFGFVESQTAMVDLKKAVATTNPPVRVYWEVKITPPE